jgi:hypothetical protein
MLRTSSNRLDIPASPITLMGLPREELDIQTVSPKQYLHIGIGKNMKVADYPFLPFDICIDGVSLVKSSKLWLWPILSAFVNKRGVKPFVIGVYAGYGSPKN